MIEAVIIDSGGANLASLVFALERLGTRATISTDAAEIVSAPRVILPGVGAAADAMGRLEEAGLVPVLPALRQPVLGICLGMQLLFTHLEEGPVAGLGVLPGTVGRLRPAAGRPVPHMGWNRLNRLLDDPLLEGISEGEYMYFVHGYAAPVADTTLATTQYGSAHAALVRSRNFWGTQFHPERSGEAGARLLANFLRLN